MIGLRSTCLSTVVYLWSFHTAFAQGPATPPAPHIEPIPVADAFSDSVGATPAQFRVDEAGGASYSIPLIAAPGTAGLAPKLSLDYSSRSPHGAIGPGFSIGGQSAISKCRFTRESGDGDAAAGSAINFDANPANDAYCLDGQRLLARGSGLGTCPAAAAGGQQFGLELDTATRVCAYKSSTALNGYAFWLAFPKDGSIRRYGTDLVHNAVIAPLSGATIAASTPELTMTWAMDRIADSTGNTIDFEYLRDNANGELNLLTVRYTGKVSISDPLSQTQTRAPYNRISFTYEQMPALAQRVDYLSGATLELTQRLSTISVYGTSNNTLDGGNVDAETLIRRYDLRYDTNTNDSALSRLISVRECAPDANNVDVCYPPTRIVWNYGGQSRGFQNAPTALADYSKGLAAVADYKIGDINGDGRQDVVSIRDRSCILDDDVASGSATRFPFQVSLGAPAGLSALVTTSVYAARRGADGSAPADCDSITGATVFDKFVPFYWENIWHLYDFTGDGRDDLLLATANGWRVHKAINLAGNWTFDATPADPGIGSDLKIDSRFADFDGDGIPDLWHPTPTNPLQFSIRFLRRTTGNAALAYAFEPASVLVEFDSMPSGTDALSMPQVERDSVQSVDVNGDGRSDLILKVTQTTFGRPAPDEPYEFRPLSAFDDPGPTVPTGCPEPPCKEFHYYWYVFINGGAQANGRYRFKADTLVGETGVATGDLPISGPSVQLADLNGDSLADLLYRRVSGTQRALFFRLNKGNDSATTRFTPEQAVGTTLTTTYSSRVLAMDANGDRRVDLIYPVDLGSGAGSNRYPLYMRLWTGGGFGPETSAATGAGSLTISGQNPEQFLTLLVDWNGNGSPDLVRYKSTFVTTSNLYIAASTLAFGGNDYITRITNGLGAVTAIEYWPMVYTSFYTRAFDGPSRQWGRGSPVFDVYSPMWAVRHVDASAPTLAGGAAAMSRIRYSYEGARIQAGGRGFLGFQRINTLDMQNLLLTSTEYRQDFPYIGRPLRTTVEKFASLATDPCATNPGGPTCVVEPPPACGPLGCPRPVHGPETFTLSGTGQLLTDAETTWSSLPSFNASAQEPVFVFAQVSDEQRYDLENADTFVQAIVATNTYDTYGNLTKAVITTSGDDGGGGSTIAETKTTENLYGCTLAPPTVAGCPANVNSELQRLGRLSIATVTSARPGETAIVRRSSFEYDATSRLLIAEIQGPYSDLEPTQSERERLELRTDYVLDANGNRTLGVKCSVAHYANRAACISLTSFVQRQWEGQPLRIQRYVRYEYDSKGRFVTGTRVPFFGGGTTTAEGYTERTGVTASGALDRAPLGDPLTTINAHGIATLNRYGTLGRAHFDRVASGGFGRSTYAWCQDAATTDLVGGGSGIPSGTRVNCPDSAVYRVATDSLASEPNLGRRIAPLMFTYFDRLGREVLKTTYTYQSSETDPGSVSRWSSVARTYDAIGRESLVTEPYFSSDPTAPQSAGRAGQALNPSTFAFSTVTFDALSRAKSLVHPEQAVNGTSSTAVEYDALLTDETNPRGHHSITVKNALGESISATSAPTESTPTGSCTPTSTLKIEYVRDAVGNVRQVKRTPCNGNSNGVPINTSMTYDRLGRKIGMADPDKGALAYRYNALGEMVEFVDAKGQTRRQYFDGLGRMWKRTETRLIGTMFEQEPTAIWEFDTALLGGGPAKALGMLKSESDDGSFRRTVEYDSFGRVARIVTQLEGVSYYQRATYDAFGRAYQTFDASPNATSPQGTLLEYANEGFPIRVREAANGTTGTIYQEVLSLSPRGQVRRERFGAIDGLVTNRTYDDVTGRMLTINTGLDLNGELQRWTYTYDKHGNVTQRWNEAGSASNHYDLKETFAYDKLDRLTQVTFNSVVAGVTQPQVVTSLTYDQLGNISSKTGLGAYTYRSTPVGCTQAGPHAVSQIGTKTYCYDANGNQTHSKVGGATVRAITYTGFDLPAAMMRNEGGIVADATFDYAPDRSYWKRTDNGGSALTISCPATSDKIFCDHFEAGSTGSTGNGTTTYYVGNVEFIWRAGAAETKRNIGSFLVITTKASGTTYEYLLRDGLGSIDAIVPVVGSTIQSAQILRLSFDVHGRRRVAAPANSTLLWTTLAPGTAAMFDTTRTTSGYTGHQQVDGIGLVHFGGRIYDPEIGRFVQADPLVEDEATQGLNRYSYVLNNPLTLTDATGYLSGAQWIGLVVAVAAAVITQQYWALDMLPQAFAVAAVGGFTSAYVSSGFNARAGLWGAVSAIAFLGIGTAFSDTLTVGTLNFRFATGSAIARIAAHAAVGGTLDELQGGSFGHGFVSAGVTKALTPAIESIGGDGEGIAGVLARTVASASLNGLVNQASGGSFVNGAATGAFQYLFNATATQQAAAEAERLVFEAIRADGGQVLRNVAIHTQTADGRVVKAVADYVAVLDERVIFGEVKTGMFSRFTNNQKVVYAAIREGRVMLSYSMQAKALNLAANVKIAAARATFILHATEGGRASRQFAKCFARGAGTAFRILGSSAVSAITLFIHTDDRGRYAGLLDSCVECAPAATYAPRR